MDNNAPTFSLEILPQEADALLEHAQLIPKGTQIFITYLSSKRWPEIVSAIQKLQTAGFTPVPHIPARHLENKQTLQSHLEDLKAHKVTHALIIGGNPTTPKGPFTKSMDILEHPSFQQSTLSHIYLAGHPEGTSFAKAEEMLEELATKIAFLKKLQKTPHIITQFCFSPKFYADFYTQIQTIAPNTPIHFGMAGCVKWKKLIKYALLSGVGPSITYLKKSPTQILNLGAYKPTQLFKKSHKELMNLETQKYNFHFFPFGNFHHTLQWIRKNIA